MASPPNPSDRRRGVGSALLAEASFAARAVGCSHLLVSTSYEKPVPGQVLWDSGITGAGKSLQATPGSLRRGMYSSDTGRIALWEAQQSL